MKTSALIKGIAMTALLLTVTAQAFAASLTIDCNYPSNVKLYELDSFSVTFLYQDGNNISMVSPDSFTSSNKNVAAINGNMVQLKKAGTVTLTATYNKCKATAKITVRGQLAFSGPASVAAKKTAKYTATMRENKVSDPNHTKLSWKVSDTKLATIDKNGTLTAKAAGTVTITATFKSKMGTFTATKTVKITGAAESVKSLAISGAATLVQEQNPVTYKLTATYSDGKKKTVSGTWKVSNTKLATVDKNGKLTPKGIGTVKLTATFGGKSATKSIKIECPSMKSVKISGAASVKVGKGSSYKLIGTLTNGKSAGQTPNATWKSSNTKIATISSDGYLVAKAAGKVTITGTYKSKNTHTAKKTVTIKK